MGAQKKGGERLAFDLILHAVTLFCVMDGTLWENLASAICIMK